MPIGKKAPPKLKVGKAPKSKPVVREKDSLDLFVDSMNKKMKGVGRIDIGRDISWLDPPRCRTGILGLDVASRGGLPRGGIVQFWGPFSSGKTTTAIHVMRSEQLRGRTTNFSAGEGFNKDWARKNGLWIPYSLEEYEAAEESGDAELAQQMRRYDAYGEEQGWGRVVVTQHIHGDGLLEATYQGVKQNLFSVSVVDSLSILRNYRQLEEMEIGDEEMGGGGQIAMFNRFMQKCFSALNTKYDDAGNIDMDGGNGNQTCIICINQARVKFGAKRGPGQGPAYQPTGGEAIKHAWHFSSEFRRGEELGEQETLDGSKAWTPWGTEIKIRCDKSKISPRGRSASWELYTEDHDEFRAGQVDTAKEVRIWGVYYNIIAQQGAWYVLPGGRRVNGKDAVTHLLRRDEATRLQIEEAVIDACRR